MFCITHSVCVRICVNLWCECFLRHLPERSVGWDITADDAGDKNVSKNSPNSLTAHKWRVFVLHVSKCVSVCVLGVSEWCFDPRLQSDRWYQNISCIFCSLQVRSPSSHLGIFFPSSVSVSPSQLHLQFWLQL